MATSTSGSLSLQWSLDSTSLSALSFGRGILQAITSDNIQPIALLACEKFGTTPPVSVETSLKIEQISRRSHSSTANFLRAQIGYSAGDAAYYLSQSDGGVRFLCLAATLCTIKEGLRRAQLLDTLLRSTARSCDSLPTVMQLNDLLRALDTKLTVSTFTNDVRGWSLLKEFSLYHGDARDREFEKRGSGVVEELVVPPNTEIEHLVRALRECFRIGQPECSIYIRSSRIFAAWTIAFVKWLTGSPPSMKFGAFASIESSSPVSLLLLQEKNYFHISLIKEVQNLDSLISTGYELDAEAHESGYNKAGNQFFGLINVQTLLALKMQRVFGTRAPAEEALILLTEAISLIIKYLPEAIVPIPFQRGLASVSETSLSISRPFPPFEQRMEIAQAALGSSLELPDTIPDLVPWRKRFEQYGGRCRQCRVCRLGITYTANDTSRNETSSCISRTAGLLASDILALCLFDIEDVASLKVSPRTKYSADTISAESEFYIEVNIGISSNWPTLVRQGWQSLILTGKVAWLSICPLDIVSFSAGLLGLEWKYKGEDKHGSSVMSKGHGQVIYPRIFDEKRLTKHNYLSLHYTQGTVRWDAMEVERITSFNSVRSWFVPLADELESLTIDYFPRIKKEISLTWKVELSQLGDEKSLVLNVSWDMSGGFGEYECNSLIFANSTALFTGGCQHSVSNPAGSLGDQLFRVETNYENSFVFRQVVDKDFSAERYYTLFESHGCPTSQLVNLAGYVNRHQNGTTQPGEYSVVHEHGCLQCALKNCLDFGATTVFC